MRIVSVNANCENEILAEPIMDEKENILIPKGTILKKEYLEAILSIGIKTLSIEEAYPMTYQPKFVVNKERYEEIVSKVRNIMEQHIQMSNNSIKRFEVIANEMIYDIKKVPDDFVIDLQASATDLYSHTVKVTFLALLMAKRLGYDDRRMRQVAIGCLLHDIGLRYITVTFQDYNMEKMDARQIFEYKKHTILGYSAVEQESWVSDISRKMILYHHERLDRSGFPMRKKIQEEECRIIQICDAFDNELSVRNQKRTPVRNTLKLFEKNENEVFDAKLIEIFLSLFTKGPIENQVDAISICSVV